MSYYIGVDGGGTKTQIALFNEKKELLDSVKVAGSNHENLPGSFAQAADILTDGIRLLLAENGLTAGDITQILMGLAGLDHPFQHEALAAELASRGLRNFSLYNDGFIVTKAALPDGVGIGYNCGTGTCCNSIAPDGTMLQIGGFGELSDDRGNGHWLAQRAFVKIYDEVCLGLAHTAMTDALCEKLEITPSRDALLAVIPKLDDPELAEELIRLLIDVFFDALNAGDPAAEAICGEMAERGADFICAHLKKQRFGDSVTVALSGSIHTKLPGERYLAALEAACRARTEKTLQFVKLDVPPVMGCINWMLEERD